MEKKIKHVCLACNAKTTDWDKHCKTKKHLKLQEQSIYCPEIFNSHIWTKFTPVFQFIPRVK